MFENSKQHNFSPSLPEALDLVEKKHPHEQLGVQKDADFRQAAIHFQKLAVILHPDSPLHPAGVNRGEALGKLYRAIEAYSQFGAKAADELGLRTPPFKPPTNLGDSLKLAIIKKVKAVFNSQRFVSDSGICSYRDYREEVLKPLGIFVLDYADQVARPLVNKICLGALAGYEPFTQRLERFLLLRGQAQEFCIWSELDQLAQPYIEREAENIFRVFTTPVIQKWLLFTKLRNQLTSEGIIDRSYFVDFAEKKIESTLSAVFSPPHIPHIEKITSYTRLRNTLVSARYFETAELDQMALPKVFALARDILRKPIFFGCSAVALEYADFARQVESSGITSARDLSISVRSDVIRLFKSSRNGQNGIASKSKKAEHAFLVELFVKRGILTAEEGEASY